MEADEYTPSLRERIEDHLQIDLTMGLGLLGFGLSVLLLGFRHSQILAVWKVLGDEFPQLVSAALLGIVLISPGFLRVLLKHGVECGAELG